MSNAKRPALRGPGQLLLVPICLTALTFSALGGKTAVASSLSLAASPARPGLTKVPPPAPHPRRSQTKNSRKIASADASVRSPIGTPPPLPAANPLRKANKSGGEARHQNNRLVIPSRLRQRDGVIMDRVKALAPLLQYDISEQDIKQLKASIDHARRGRHSQAVDSRRLIADPHVRKLALWYSFRRAKAHPDPLRIERFRRANSDWPSGGILRRNVERLLLGSDEIDTDAVFELYGQKQPTSGIGKFLLAHALMLKGRQAEAIKLARAAWHRDALSQKLEADLLEKFGDHLTKADHLRRANHFLYKDRRRQIPIVRRAAKRLDEAARKKVHLRMEVVKRRLNAAEKEYRKLGPAAMKDPGLRFNRIQLLRRKKRYEEAWALLHAAPLDGKSLVEPDEWWIERRVNVRYALRQNKPRHAYKIVSRHGPIKRKYLAEAEFLSGWIALRKLRKPALAEKHFRAMRKAVASRPLIAKAEYWLGRTLDAKRDNIGALTHYTNAAAYHRTYHGQLALQRIDSSGRLKAQAGSGPDKADLKRFLARDAVRALIIAHKAQLDDITPLFFSRLAWRLKNPGEMALLAELASLIHSRRGSVITGKVGVYRGFNLDRYAYPINAMPQFKRLTPEVDKAFVMALVRQESEFNGKARSHAGARGLMQIMPGTGRMIARQFKVRYSRAKLGSDPSYNAMLGVAHLYDLLEKYNGSYILTLVAYNAGPGRVRDWIEDLGDPRADHVDAIDWVEAIPFSETRRYVQRILSSAQIFRQRLRNGQSRIRLVQDLNKGHPGEERKKAELEQPAESATAKR